MVLATPSMHERANIEDDVPAWAIVVAVIVVLLQYLCSAYHAFFGSACNAERRRLMFGTPQGHVGSGMSVQPAHAVAVPMQGVPVAAEVVPVQPQVGLAQKLSARSRLRPRCPLRPRPSRPRIVCSQVAIARPTQVPVATAVAVPVAAVPVAK